MDSSTTILGVVAILAIVSLMALACLAEHITRDRLADERSMIEIGDALFTAEEYAKCVQLRLTYHSTPTTRRSDEP